MKTLDDKRRSCWWFTFKQNTYLKSDKVICGRRAQVSMMCLGKVAMGVFQMEGDWKHRSRGVAVLGDVVEDAIFLSNKLDDLCS